jgi:hypothetical protein
MRPSDAAKDWLLSLRQQSMDKGLIATHAPPEYPEEIKRRFAEKIKQKKRAEASHRE